MAGAVYSFEEHMIKKQARAEEAMLKELRSRAYTIDNPLVSYNLYLINPLSAVISFYTEEETAVTVTVFGKAKEGNITHTFPRAKEHVLPVVGLYSGQVNRVEVREYREKYIRWKSRCLTYLKGIHRLNPWIRRRNTYRTTAFSYLRRGRSWRWLLTMREISDGA
ncbi:aryl-sulfate sulfotransferase N-terminal domain-containing protein [Hungatella effluvii]|uniref:aryl-sulfate sulfotransferase N-terminal domain-containing protein n=1 Tax=Hungatella effluvii TaxID=1096246 RepID=UPI002A7F9CF4|nr:aryl-sulfate sulfotransferase N-terminal domain-containing protein [Hungatella effluvii]